MHTAWHADHTHGDLGLEWKLNVTVTFQATPSQVLELREALYANMIDEDPSGGEWMHTFGV